MKIDKSQNEYYSGLFKKYGYSPLAVAGKAEEYKNLRYEKVSGIFFNDNNFSLHDVGSGLGHYYPFLKKRLKEKKFDYSGSEINKEFYNFCKKKYPEVEFFLRDLSKKVHDNKYDYLIITGVFYHTCGVDHKKWQKFCFKLIDNCFKMAKKGIACNFITEFVDYKKDDLYYCNIDKITNYIVSNLSRFFNIYHAYPLYEFTLNIFKESYIKQKFQNKSFNKYFKL